MSLAACLAVLLQPVVTTPAIEPEVPELDFKGLFFTRATHTNVVSSGALFRNLQIGRLGSPDSGATTEGDGNTFIEQRVIGFFDYTPALWQGNAVFRSAFEIDFTWGDAANQVQENAGGGMNGDVVNLQTKRLQMDLTLDRGLVLTLGLQTLADNPRRPTEATPDELVHGGTHLMFWGTDAAGASLFWRPHRRILSRAGYFLLWENAPDKNDDVHLALLDVEFGVAPATQVGLHLWYLNDGSAQQQSGPGSRLSRLTAGTQLVPGRGRVLQQADVAWLAVDAHYNLFLNGGPFTIGGFAALNGGDFETRISDASIAVPDAPEPSLLAFLVDAEAAWRWGHSNGDFVSLEGLYASGDEAPGDQVVSSVITGNGYGLPGALALTHRSLLLLPDGKAVNRQVAAVYDPANLGYGLMAAFLNAGADLVRYKWNVKLGLATAQSAARPVDGGRQIGTEVNFETLYQVYPLLWLGAHAAYLRLGSFYDGARFDADAPPLDNPYTAFATATWVML